MTRNAVLIFISMLFASACFGQDFTQYDNRDSLCSVECITPSIDSRHFGLDSSGITVGPSASFKIERFITQAYMCDSCDTTWYRARAQSSQSSNPFNFFALTDWNGFGGNVIHSGVVYLGSRFVNFAFLHCFTDTVVFKTELEVQNRTFFISSMRTSCRPLNDTCTILSCDTLYDPFIKVYRDTVGDTTVVDTIPPDPSFPGQPDPDPSDSTTLGTDDEIGDHADVYFIRNNIIHAKRGIRVYSTNGGVVLSLQRGMSVRLRNGSYVIRWERDGYWYYHKIVVLY